MFAGRTIDVPSMFIGGKSDWGVYQNPGALERMQKVACTKMSRRTSSRAPDTVTHDDVYKPLPGYKVLVSHFHFHFNEQLADTSTIDLQPTWLPVFRDLGINIAILADFHGDSHPKTPASRASTSRRSTSMAARASRIAICCSFPARSPTPISAAITCSCSPGPVLHPR